MPESGPIRIEITKYCRWCRAPFETFRECHEHQDQCNLRYVHDLTEKQRLKELTIDPGDIGLNLT